MIVMKFGGATLQDVPSIRNVVQIVSERFQENPILVISAMGKTTRRLLESAQKACGGDTTSASEILNTLFEFHEQTARTLVPHWEMTMGAQRVSQFISEIKKLVEGISVLGELSPRTQDKMLAYGELIASSILVEVLSHLGIPAAWLDAREHVITDDRFTHANPIREITEAKLKESILALVSKGMVPVIQGYIGATRNGATTTLGFEGSDFTAAIVGTALDVKEIQIWKDVPGVMTADPELVPEAYIVPEISFAEMAELTYWGAKVLHPRAVWPAIEKNIPIRVLCTRAPKSPGTFISQAIPPCSFPIRSIAYKKPLTFVRAHSRFLSDTDIFWKLFESMDRYEIWPHFVSMGGSGILMGFQSNPDQDHLMDIFSLFGNPQIFSNKASVSLVGISLSSHMPLILKEIAKFPIEWIVHGVSTINCTFIVDGETIPDLLPKLHRAFFS